jgi:7-cyano-7-deazaguanine synthase
MRNDAVILLLSGGIDSTTLLAKLSMEGKRVYAISFDYGQRNLIELQYAKVNALKYNVVEHKTVNIDNSAFMTKSSLTNHTMPVTKFSSTEEGVISEYVPSRNLIFLSFALSYAETIGCDSLYVGFNKDDSKHFPDCTPAFVEQINLLTNVTGTRNEDLKVYAPFIYYTKKEIIKMARDLNVEIGDTISCYNPSGANECGKCYSCSAKYND